MLRDLRPGDIVRPSAPAIPSAQPEASDRDALRTRRQNTEPAPPAEPLPTEASARMQEAAVAGHFLDEFGEEWLVLPPPEPPSARAAPPA